MKKKQLAYAKFVQTKEREVKNGHDGTWVAHPGFYPVPVAKKIFDKFNTKSNRIKNTKTIILQRQIY